MHILHKIIWKTGVCAGFVMTSFSLMLLQTTSAQNWGTIPPELRAMTLRKLVEGGDYKALISAYETSVVNMKQVIDADPVLIGAYTGIQALKNPLDNLAEIIPIGEAADIENAIKQIIDTAEKKSYINDEFNQEVFSLLGNLIFKNVEKMIDKEQALSSVSKISDPMTTFLPLFGEKIPVEYLPKFDALLKHILENTKSAPALSYKYAIYGLQGLAVNKNIPPDAVRNRLNALKEQAIRAGVMNEETVAGPIRELIDSVLMALPEHK